MRDAIAELEKWRSEHKARSVTIVIDSGYGATCWTVDLSGEVKRTVSVAEVELMGPGDDWPGLARTILAAVDKWNGGP